MSAICGYYKAAVTVDSEYMSIYKEDKNKKDGFEHLISLQTVTTIVMRTLTAPPVGMMAI